MESNPKATHQSIKFSAELCTVLDSFITSPTGMATDSAAVHQRRAQARDATPPKPK